MRPTNRNTYEDIRLIEQWGKGVTSDYELQLATQRMKA